MLANANWIDAVSKELHGHAISEQVRSLPSINVGVTPGSLGGMLQYLGAIALITDLLNARDYEICQVGKDCNGPTAQGIVNYFFYSGSFDAIDLRVKMFQPRLRLCKFQFSSP